MIKREMIIFIAIVTILSLSGCISESPDDGDEKPPSAPPPGPTFENVMFLHHSTGANLIEQGRVRQRLTNLGYAFYDHGYNEDGLVLADGTWTGRNFAVPDDNTNPDGFAAIFAQPLHDPPDNTFSHLMQYDVIAFKSCFPVSHIESDTQLAECKSYYLSIRDRMDQYPNKIFIVITPPPEIPFDTDSEAAARARAFADWLASDEYLSGHPNVFSFNFFDLLADPSDNMLRAEYRRDEYDAHPNELANQNIGPIFADFIDQAVRAYAGTVEPSSTPEPTSVTPTPTASAAITMSTELIQASDLAYQGAFRLPEGSGGSNWGYSGYAATYYPEGDPSGPNDGYPGSIFAVGHDHQQYVSEISIPVPVISNDLSELNTAMTLQGFQDLTGGMFGYLEIPRAGLEYLPAQGSQTKGKLHFCWGQHFQGDEASHGWCELDLSNPQPAGPWHFGDYTNYVTNDYLFEIPDAWAAANTPGQLLATGRFRDGHWGGLGPALFAYGPWNDGNPPASNDRLDTITPLLLYGIQEPGMIEITISDSMKMNTFKEADEWSGGAWLTAGDKSAVIFVGTKATGDCWYGFADGTVWPTDIDEDTVYPEVPDWPHDDRGWWSEGIEAQIIFYDPADLAAVARGDMESWEPQPYASRSIDEYLFDPGFNLERGKRYLVGAVCFDRARGLLYVIERMAGEEEKSLVHVWKVE